jgi:hypothetical protein
MDADFRLLPGDAVRAVESMAEAFDIEAVLAANRDAIDLDLIRTQWSPFADLGPERTAWLEAVIGKRVVRRE